MRATFYDEPDRALYHWSKQFAEEGEQAFPGSGHQSAQEEEIRRLKRELEITRQERDILKKGSVRTEKQPWCKVASRDILMVIEISVMRSEL